MIKAYNAKQWEIPLLQDGSKTVARWIVKCGKSYPGYHDRDKFYGIVDHLNNDYKNWYAGFYNDKDVFTGLDGKQHIDALYWKAPCKPGDILYVREAWGDYRECQEGGCGYYMYRADYPDGATTYLYDEETVCDLPRWHPSINMPKDAARIWLKVTDVRVERLQEITEEQAQAEGCNSGMLTGPCTARGQFENLWDCVIKKSDFDRYGWDANPWVWVIEFERCEKPENI